MKLYKITKSDPANLSDLKKEYYNGLTSPLDGMWEVFTTMADHYSISVNDEHVGYCVINDEKKMLQFYVVSSVDPMTVFLQILKDYSLSTAMVHSFETPFFNLCLDHQTAVSVNALQYHVAENTKLSPAQLGSAQFTLMTHTQLEAAVDFAHDALGADRGWLHGYYKERIQRNELYGLWLENKLIGAGECRISSTQTSVADVGMVVAKSHRTQGIGTEILKGLIQLCKERDLMAICSTEVGNIGAQKAITKSGFIAVQRIVEITF